MPSRRSHAAALALSALFLLGSIAAVFVPSPARAGIAVVFSEDFESGAIGRRWNASDQNPNSGLDYWGISSQRAHNSTYSAWCAEVGTQSDTGLDNSAVQQYDDNMQADLVINLTVSGFTSLTLSFYYWSKAESGGGDFIEAWYVAGGVSTALPFRTRGTANWDLASVPVPNNIETLIIRWTSDGANHAFEGAYVDDIVLTGTENVAPTSSVSPLPTYTNAVPYFVPYTARDNPNASGIAYVELWWRMGGSGNYTLYSRPSNPLGRWNPSVSPAIPFDRAYAAGDGRYELYTIAVDNATNSEAPPASADASITVDTVAPTLTIDSPTMNATVNGDSVDVAWTAQDATSGIDHYEVWLDSESPTSTSTPSLTRTGLANGAHTFHVAAIDRAGNRREASVSFTVNANPYVWLWWLLLLIVVAFGTFMLFLFWRERRKDKEQRLPGASEGGEEPASGEADRPESEPETQDEVDEPVPDVDTEGPE